MPFFMRLGLLWLLSAFCSASFAGIPVGRINAINAQLAAGQYQAAEKAALVLLETQPLTTDDVSTLETLAGGFTAAGLRDQAGTLLSKAAELLDAPQTSSDRATLLRIGASLQALNLRSQAVGILTRGIRITGKDAADSLNAAGFQSLGDLAFETGDLEAADSAYTNSETALEANDLQARAALLVRQIKLAVASTDPAQTRDYYKAYQGLLLQLPGDTSLARMNLNVAASLMASGESTWAPDITLLIEQSAMIGAADAQLMSEVEQMRGQVAALSGQPDAALKMLRRALAGLGADATPAQTYRLYWQIGKLQAQAGEIDAALTNYERAIANLDRIRGELLQGSTLVFTERVLPVYQGYIELLLEKAEVPGQESKWLGQVQETLEGLNAAEILDYFDDNCVLPRDVMSLSNTAAGTAVLYPITLGTRPVLLVRTANGIFRFDLAVDNDELKSMALAFREAITNPKTSLSAYQAQASALFTALLGPAQSLIERSSITTLVTVPSAYLRLVPMAALHDGEDFLVNRYQLATTLGLQLTENASVDNVNSSAFIGGVSDAVQGFVSLPGVETELAELKGALSATPLLNRNFSVANVSNRLSSGNDSIVHLATHGYFDGDHANSFLLAHDDKITLDRLQSTVGARRFTGNPLDLLVLSACETAKGDERAALGLAGVSLKAGARSTVASLWPIADAATAMLMKRFYEELRSGKSKAAALQSAQQMLLSDPEWAHPNYWSPYLLIGNWL